ncbi:MAG: protein kinase [Holosporales bacterium]|jgi:hypothetical protein|nr:protein kinase [Holosporales bacterium]
MMPGTRKNHRLANPQTRLAEFGLQDLFYALARGIKAVWRYCLLSLMLVVTAIASQPDTPPDADPAPTLHFLLDPVPRGIAHEIFAIELDCRHETLAQAPQLRTGSGDAVIIPNPIDSMTDVAPERPSVPEHFSSVTPFSRFGIIYEDDLARAVLLSFHADFPCHELILDACSGYAVSGPVIEVLGDLCAKGIIPTKDVVLKDIVQLFTIAKTHEEVEYLRQQLSLLNVISGDDIKSLTDALNSFDEDAELVAQFMADLPTLPKVDYKVIRDLGSGRYGTVRLVRVKCGNRWVVFAVKLYVVDEIDDEHIELCENDVYQKFIPIAADSPFVCPIWRAELPTREFGPVIWTPYFDSSSLDSCLKDQRLPVGERTMLPLSATDKASIILGLVLGVKALHENNLFHGNLKPSDVLLDNRLVAKAVSAPRKARAGNDLRNSSNGWWVHLTDYISYTLEHYRLTYACLVSTPNYAPPESYQFDNDDFDVNDQGCIDKLRKVDIFSLGLIIYEILTGDPVFSPDLSAAELRRKTQSRDRPAIPAGVHPKLKEIIEWCWDMCASQRWNIGRIWHEICNIDFAILEGVDTAVLEERFGGFR